MEKRYTLIGIYILLLVEFQLNFASQQPFKGTETERRRQRTEKYSKKERTLLDSKDFSKSEKKLWCITNLKESKSAQESVLDELCVGSSSDEDNISSVFECLLDSDLEVLVSSSCGLDSFSSEEQQEEQLSVDSKCVQIKLPSVQLQSWFNDNEVTVQQNDCTVIKSLEDIKKSCELPKNNRFR